MRAAHKRWIQRLRALRAIPIVGVVFLLELNFHYASHLFTSGKAVDDILDGLIQQCAHAAGNRSPAQLDLRGSADDQLPYRRSHGKQLINSDTALISRESAGFATFATKESLVVA